MKTIIMISHILLVSFLYLSCNDDEDNKNLDVNELKNRWVLERTIDKQTGDIDSIKKGGTGVLTFHGENCVMVDGPYNIGPGKFELKGNNLSISIILRTQYNNDSFYTDCGFFHPVILDDIFFNNLNGAYSIKGDKLTINSEGDFNLEFYKADLNFIYNCFEAKPEILIDSIPENKYNATEIFEGADTAIYGKWMLVKKCGVLAISEYKLKYDYFEAKKSGIYGVIRNDSILEYGKMSIYDQTDERLTIYFERDENANRYPPCYKFAYFEHYGQNVMVLRDAYNDGYSRIFIKKTE